METAGADRDSMAESSRAKRWWGVRMDEGEMGETFLCSISHGDKAATTWGGGHRRRTVTTTSPHVVSRAHMSYRRELFKQLPRLTSGPRLFFDFSRFSIFQIFKSKSMTFPLSKLRQYLQVDRLKHKEQLFFLSQLQIPLGFQVTISGTNSNLNLP
jgi:hypothetical protein